MVCLLHPTEKLHLEYLLFFNSRALERKKIILSLFKDNEKYFTKILIYTIAKTKKNIFTKSIMRGRLIVLGIKKKCMEPNKTMKFRKEYK